MNLRQRLLLMFSLTVICAVAAVAYVVSLRTREAFADADRERTNSLAAQFHREFDRRGLEVQAPPASHGSQRSRLRASPSISAATATLPSI